MIEILVLVFVTWNAVLQTIWFWWSIKQHADKHEEVQEVQEFPELKHVYVDGKEMQKVFSDGVQVFPKRNEDGKYNPDEIKGSLDDFFGEVK